LKLNTIIYRLAVVTDPSLPEPASTLQQHSLFFVVLYEKDLTMARLTTDTTFVGVFLLRHQSMHVYAAYLNPHPHPHPLGGENRRSFLSYK
jgi:hypothetical protein